MGRKAEKVIELSDGATTSTIASSKGVAGQAEWRVANCPGLVLLVRDGAGTWFLGYSVNGARRKMKIGDAGRGGIRASDAWTKAKQHREKITLESADPLEDRRAKVAEAATAFSFAEVFEQYMAHAANRGRPAVRTRTLYRRAIEADALPVIGKMPIKAVTADHLTRIMSDIEKRGALVQANNTKIALSSVIKFALGERIIKANPMIGVKKGTVGSARKRVPTDHEIAALWQAIDSAPKMDDGTRRALKLVILTGQRRGEVAGARPSELRLDDALIGPNGDKGATWTIAADLEKGGRIVTESRTKNGRGQVVRLSRQAVALFREQLEANTNAKTRGDGQLFQVEENTLTQAQRRTCKRVGVDDLTIHDMRRAIANWLKGAGFSRDIRDVVLNHVDSSVDGRHYANDGDVLAAPARKAWQAWADHVERIVSGVGAGVGHGVGNVVALRG